MTKPRRVDVSAEAVLGRTELLGIFNHVRADEQPAIGSRPNAAGVPHEDCDATAIQAAFDAVEDK
jgi:hypothetical protein